MHPIHKKPRDLLILPGVWTVEATLAESQLLGTKDLFERRQSSETSGLGAQPTG